MKKIERQTVKFILIVVSIMGISAMLNASSYDSGNSAKEMDLSNYHNVGNIWMRVSNYGTIGSKGTEWPSLEYPAGSGIDYLYTGAIWFGAKKYRRDNDGNIVYEIDPVSGDTVAVVDTLTSIGFDGYHDIMELLPAYNPLEENPLGYQYDYYNDKDYAIKFFNINHTLNYDDDGDGLIDEDGLGKNFTLNAPDSIYCFTIPFDDDNDGLVDEDGGYLGIENIISYYYDYSPFGTLGNRDWGSWSSSNIHIPLNIAIKQESYVWPRYNIEQLVIIKNTIYNVSIDTLYDYAFSFYIDADIGPQAWDGQIISTDDISSYVTGQGNEFAYSYDADGDSNLATGYLGLKVFGGINHDCWTYSSDVQPPDDFDPQSDPFGCKITANEKYWLQTGRNPRPYSPDDFISLRDDPNAQIGNPCDTRFLYTVYGSQPGTPGYNPDERWYIAPNDSVVFYTALFMGDSLSNLMEINDIAQGFYETGFDPTYLEQFATYPALDDLINYGDGDRIIVNWVYKNVVVDSYMVYYKKEDAEEWDYISVSDTVTSYIISGLEDTTMYVVKVAAVQNSNIYESFPKTIVTNDVPYIAENVQVFPGFEKILLTYWEPEKLNYNQELFYIYRDNVIVDSIYFGEDTYFLETVLDTITHSYCIGAPDGDGDIAFTDTLECKAIIRQNKLLVVDGIAGHLFFPEEETDSLMLGIIENSGIIGDYDSWNFIDLDDYGYHEDALSLSELGEYSTIILFSDFLTGDNFDKFIEYENYLYECLQQHYVYLVYESSLMLDLLEQNGTKLIVNVHSMNNYYGNLFGVENTEHGFTDDVIDVIIKMNANTAIPELNDLEIAVDNQITQLFDGIPYISICTPIDDSVAVLYTCDELNNNPDFEDKPVVVHNYKNGKNTALILNPIVWFDTDEVGNLICYLDSLTITDVDDNYDNEKILSNYTCLFQNSPNPFNPKTKIQYTIPKDTKVELKIYNIKGQLIKTLVDEKQKKGKHSLIWNGKNKNGKPVSSGIYFYKLKTDNYSDVKKMLLLK